MSRHRSGVGLVALLAVATMLLSGGAVAAPLVSTGTAASMDAGPVASTDSGPVASATVATVPSTGAAASGLSTASLGPAGEGLPDCEESNDLRSVVPPIFSASGTVEEDDPSGYKGHYEPVQFEVEKPRKVTISTRRTSHRVIAPDGTILSSARPTYDSETRTFRAESTAALPEAGVYTVAVTTSVGFSGEPYLMEVRPKGSFDVDSISQDETVSGKIDSQDPTTTKAHPTLDPGVHYEPVEFQGTKGESVSFEGYDIEIRDPSGEIVASNAPDGGNGLTVDSLPATGTYTVRNYAVNTDGSPNTLPRYYALTYGNPPSSTGDGHVDRRRIDYGSVVDGEIDPCDPADPNYDGYHEPVTFQGSAGDIITATMTASSGDTRLLLVDPTGRVVASNADGGRGSSTPGVESSEIGGYALKRSGQYTLIAAGPKSTTATLEYSLELRKTGTVPKADGSYLVVDGEADGDSEYPTIGRALLATTPGDTVEVKPGTYEERLQLRQSVTLTAPEGATLKGSGRDAGSTGIVIASGAAPTVSGLTITDFTTAVDASGTGTSWRLDGLTIRNADEAVLATATGGDWTVAGLSASGVGDGIDAYESTGDWRVTGSSFRNVEKGVNAFKSKGDWTVADSTFTTVESEFGRRDAIKADSATGAWTITGTTISGVRRGIDADDTAGAWEVHRTTITDHTRQGIRAKGASPQGDAAENYWGPDGLESDDCVGNVDCTPALSTDPNAVLDLRSISYGAQKPGELDAEDPTATHGRHEPVTFAGSRGDVVSATMTASSDDTYLKLVGPDGTVLAENDDALDNRPGGQGSAFRREILPKDGTYTLIATSPESAPAFEYTLSLSKTGTADPAAERDLRSISYGTTKTGGLTEADPDGYRGDHEPVTFTGSEDDLVDVSVSNAGADTYLVLEAPDGSTVASGTDTDLTNVALPTDGEYTLVVTSRADETTGDTSVGPFAYDLTLRKTGTATADLRSIAYGQTGSGEVGPDDDPAGDPTNQPYVEPVTFVGKAGEFPRVTVDAEVAMRLVGPEGSTIAETTAGTDRLPIRELPADGTYTIQVRETEQFGDDPTSHEYDLTLARLETTDLSTIAYGQTKTGALDPDDPTRTPEFESGPVTVESVTFDGSQGDGVRVEVPSSGVALRLVGPDGSTVAESTFVGESTGQSLATTLPADGSYTIEVYDQDVASSVEPYRLSLDRVVTDLREIEYGQTRRGRLEGSDPRPVTFGTRAEPVTFEGRAGDVVSVRVAPDGEQNTVVTLLGPSSDWLGIAATGPDIRLGGERNTGPATVDRVTLPADGTYTVEVATTDSVADGGSSGPLGGDIPGYGYDLTLERVGSGPAPVDLRSIAVDETKAGAVDPADPEGLPRGVVTRLPDDRDRENVHHEPVTFEGSAGDELSVSLAGGEGAVVLLGPGGEQVAPSSGPQSGFTGVELPSDGTYTLVVRPTGDRLSTTSLPLRYDLTLVSGGTLDLRSIGYNETATSRIDTEDPDATANGGLHEPVTFTGNRSDVVTVTATGGAAPRLQLRGPDGSVVAETTDGGPAGTPSAKLEQELPQRGTYTIVVTGAAGPDATLDYTLELRRVAVGITAPVEENETREPIDLREITYGALKHGEVDDGDPLGRRGHYENVSFDALAGDVVNVTMTPEGANASYLAIVGPNGTVRNESVGSPGAAAAAGATGSGGALSGAAPTAAPATTATAPPVELTEVRLPVEGNYTIVAGTRETNATGRYELELKHVRREEPNLVAQHLEFESAYVDRLVLTEDATYTTVVTLNNTDDEFHYFDIPTRVDRLPRKDGSLTTMNATNVTVGLDAGERRTVRWERTVEGSPSGPRGGRVSVNGTTVGNVSVLPGDGVLDGVTYAYTTAQPAGSSQYEVVAVVHNGGTSAKTYSVAFVPPGVAADAGALGGGGSEVKVGMVHVEPGETRRIRIETDTATSDSGRGVWYVGGQPAPLVGTVDDDTDDWG